MDEHCKEMSTMNDLNNANQEMELEEDKSSQEEPMVKEEKAGDSLTSEKLKKRRRSSAGFPSPLGDSPDSTSRFGRTRKPKVSFCLQYLISLHYLMLFVFYFCFPLVNSYFQHDSDDFLPTDAVLGKSPPKKNKLPTDAALKQLPPTKNRRSLHLVNSTLALKDLGDYDESVGESIDNEMKLELLNDDEIKFEKDSENDLKESPGEKANGPLEDIATEYEPGDLIWGRLGHHPFWPCIVINDPVDHIYFKKSGEYERRFQRMY